MTHRGQDTRKVQSARDCMSDYLLKVGLAMPSRVSERLPPALCRS